MVNKLKKSEYFKNSATLIVGTGLVQIIPILLQPILRRIYTDEDFGNFAIYYSIVSIFATVANFKYADSIVLPKEQKKGISLLLGALLLNLLFSIVIFIVFAFFGSIIFEYFQASVFLRSNYWVFPLGVFLISTNLTFNFWLTRLKIFKGIVLNKGIRRISEGGAQMVLSNSFRKGGLIFGSLIGDFINLLIYYFQFIKSGGSFKKVNKKDVMESLKEQSDFPKYSFLPAFLNIVSTNLPILIISSYYSKSIVGQFDGSRLLLALPLALISASLAQVLYQKLVELKNNNEAISPILRDNFLTLTGLALLGSVIIYFFGILIYTFVLGDNYLLAGQLSTVLIFSYAIRFIVSPLSVVFMATKTMKISAIWQLLYFGCMTIMLYFDNLSIEEFVLYFVVIDVFVYIIYGLMIFFTARKVDNSNNVQNI